MKLDDLPIGSRFIERPKRNYRDGHGIKIVFRKVGDNKARSLLTFRVCAFKPGTKVQRVTR